MNFLSHFYFDRHNTDANAVMGSVLPDLIKNAVKDANLHPQKHENIFLELDEIGLLTGWKKHLDVDIFFHSSDFFIQKTKELKILIKPLLQETPIRPSFLAHIGLELLLDHLLIEQNLIQVNSFYQYLNQVDKNSLSIFLKKAGLKNPDLFFSFLEKFLSSKYLLSYQKIENISYALNRICMRLWPESLSETQIDELTTQIEHFKKDLQKDFLNIFNEINQKLKKQT